MRKLKRALAIVTAVCVIAGNVMMDPVPLYAAENSDAQIEQETGNQETKYSVKINNFQINLHKSVPNFEKYDTIETYKKLKLFSNFYLPIGIVEYTYKEYEEIVVIHSIEEAKQIGEDRAAEELKDEIEGKEILDKQVKVKSEADYIEVEVTYEVEENIGIEEKIVF